MLAINTFDTVSAGDCPLSPRAFSFDPSSPIMLSSAGDLQQPGHVRHDKRYRRSRILAAIRTLLMQRGAQGVTIREIALHSGYSVQTLYNLVGRQNEAIEDAVAEYARFVMQEAVITPHDPCALFDILDNWIETIAATPDYCIQSTQAYFSEATRGLYYKNRQSHASIMMTLLQKQERCGVIQKGVNVEELAAQLILFSSASCLEWSDEVLSFERLKSRLYSGFVSLISDKVESDHRGAIDKRVREFA